MIDPYALEGKWTRRRLEEWILFAICVCNKPANATAIKVDAILRDLREAVGFRGPSSTPFELVRSAACQNTLRAVLEKHRVGQYTRIERAFREVVTKIPEVLSTTVAELETVSGIGPKSARMILLYVKPQLRVAALDTHVLRWLRDQGYNAPKGTPSGRRYAELEKIVLAEADNRGLTPKELDKKIWQSYALPRVSS